MAENVPFTWKNWWDYHKWYVIGGVTVAAIAGSILINKLSTPKPDVQIAYVGEYALPDDTAAAVEREFAARCGDFNGDGRVLVTLNQYPDVAGDPNAAPGTMTASEVRLMADLVDCESYFFLLEDPDGFQRQNQALALPDGNCPDDFDRTGLDKTLRWGDCPILASLPLGEWEDTVLGGSASGDNQALMENLYLGRRCFYGERTVQNLEGCTALWETLTEGGFSG